MDNSYISKVHLQVAMFHIISDICILPCLAEVTIGFNPTTYSVSEDLGSVSVAVSLLNGILARDVIVSLQTVDGMAVGESLNKLASCSQGMQ